MAKLYLDCDGVLADFEGGAERVLGMSVISHERRFGPGRFWDILAAVPHFFETLDLLPDACELYEAVRDLAPTILTGVPPGDWAAPQKQRWASRHFPNVPIITTPAARKREHCQRGDVLIDDWASRRRAWQRAGGIFIHHISATRSITALREKGVLAA